MTSQMPDKSEKARRKEMLQAQREEARRKVRESLPASPVTLKALFTHIDSKLESGECDDTLRHAREFIRNKGLSEEALISWLESNGGYCDCEVLANVEQVLEDAVTGYADLR